MDDTVTVKAAVPYRRWNAPNFATMAVSPRTRQEGFHEAPSTPVAQLAPEVLDALALC